MKKQILPDLPRIYLLPTSDNLVKGGVILYLLGITCTFFYYSQFNVLSVDFLKPNAIILGIYQWIYFVLFPRSILLFIYTVSKSNWTTTISLILFTFFLIAGNILLSLLFNSLSWSTVLAIMFFVVLIIGFHIDFYKWKLNIAPAIFKTYFFSVLFCIIFSYFMFPRIPYELGGGMPVKVTVISSDTTLLNSRYSKSIYLLYTTDNDYYFIEKKQDANTQLIYEYLIKKVNKSEIKKIEFTKPIWQPF